MEFFEFFDDGGGEGFEGSEGFEGLEGFDVGYHHQHPEIFSHRHSISDISYWQSSKNIIERAEEKQERNERRKEEGNVNTNINTKTEIKRKRGGHKKEFLRNRKRNFHCMSRASVV